MKLKEIKLSTKQMLLDIGSMGQYAKKLLEIEHDYNLLLEGILDLEYFRDEQADLPTLKDLSNQLNIQYSLLRKQIRQIYEDLLFNFDVDYDRQFSFPILAIAFS